MISGSYLKVSFIVGTLGQGGAERQLYYYIKALVEGRSKVYVLCLTKGDYWEKRIKELGVPVMWVGQSHIRLLRLMSIVQHIRRHPVDIIYSQHFHTNLYASFAAFMTGKRVYGSIRNNAYQEIDSVGNFLGTLSLRLPKMIVANSKTGMQNAVKLGKKEDRLFLLPNVVDESIFFPGSREKITTKFIVTFIGRLYQQKRVDRIICLAKKFIHKQCDIEFRIYGDGPLLEELTELANHQGVLNQNLFFYGLTSDAVSAYQESDVLLLTSDYEGTPNVVLEALSCGLPIVASDVGDVSELVKDGENGFIFSPSDLDTAYEKLLLLYRDQALRARMGHKNRQYVLDQRSYATLHKTLDDLFTHTHH
ncbi:MAG: glycosyltransferase [Anaerolineae bacterium]|nr:glycosyltransferase [Anaerolineae bacterium]